MDISPNDSAVIRSFEGESGKAKLELKTSREKPLVIQKVDLDNPQLKYILNPPAGATVAKDQSYALTLESPADMAAGNYGGIIKVSTNVAEQPVIDISYSLNIQKLISVQPAQVFMNISTRPYKVQVPAAVDARTGPSATSAVAAPLEVGKDYPVSDVQNEWAQVRFPDGKLAWADLKKVKPTYGGALNSLRVTKHLKSAEPAAPPAAQGNANDPAFVVKEAKSDLSALTTHVESRPDASWLVNLQYEGPLEAKSFQGKVTLMTNDAKEPEIVVPVQITIGQMEHQQMPRPPQPLTRPDAKIMSVQPQPVQIKTVQPGEKK